MLSVACGVLTVGAGYLLGRIVGGRRARARHRAVRRLRAGSRAWSQEARMYASRRSCSGSQWPRWHGRWRETGRRLPPGLCTSSEARRRCGPITRRRCFPSPPWSCPRQLPAACPRRPGANLPSYRSSRGSPGGTVPARLARVPPNFGGQRRQLVRAKSNCAARDGGGRDRTSAVGRTIGARGRSGQRLRSDSGRSRSPV